MEANRIPDVFWEWTAALYTHTDTFVHDADLIKSAVPLWGKKAELTMTPEVLAQIEPPTAFYWGAADTFLPERRKTESRLKPKETPT